MVQDTGEAKGPGGVRPLGLPQPIQVKADARGWPLAVKLGRCWVPVTVEDRWRVDDEWWRERGVSRLYFSLLLEDGRRVTVYNGLGCDRWWRQEYR